MWGEGELALLFKRCQKLQKKNARDTKTLIEATAATQYRLNQVQDLIRKLLSLLGPSDSDIVGELQQAATAFLGSAHAPGQRAAGVGREGAVLHEDRRLARNREILEIMQSITIGLKQSSHMLTSPPSKMRPSKAQRQLEKQQKAVRRRKRAEKNFKMEALRLTAGKGSVEDIINALKHDDEDVRADCAEPAARLRASSEHSPPSTTKATKSSRPRSVSNISASAPAPSPSSCLTSPDVALSPANVARIVATPPATEYSPKTSPCSTANPVLGKTTSSTTSTNSGVTANTACGKSSGQYDANEPRSATTASKSAPNLECATSRGDDAAAALAGRAGSCARTLSTKSSSTPISTPPTPKAEPPSLPPPVQLPTTMSAVAASGNAKNEPTLVKSPQSRTQCRRLTLASTALSGPSDNLSSSTGGGPATGASSPVASRPAKPPVKQKTPRGSRIAALASALAVASNPKLKKTVEAESAARTATPTSGAENLKPSTSAASAILDDSEHIFTAELVSDRVKRAVGSNGMALSLFMQGYKEMMQFGETIRNENYDYSNHTTGEFEMQAGAMKPIQTSSFDNSLPLVAQPERVHSLKRSKQPPALPATAPPPPPSHHDVSF